jgi:hypothetical protein
VFRLLRKMEVDTAEVQGQYGCLNFHAKCGGQRARLIIAIKNKWSRAWTQAWFYCKVPLLQSLNPTHSKGISALHSYMNVLDFVTEPSFECGDNDAGGVAFIKATHSIGARDVIEEYMACGVFSSVSGFWLGRG